MTSCNRPDSDTYLEIIEKEEYQVNNLLETFDWLSRTAEELGIDEKYSDSLSIGIRGKIFDSPANGIVLFDPADFTNKVFHEVVLYVERQDLSFDQCLSDLEECYGKAYLSSEEPYAQANGGTVIWYSFYTGKGIVHIFMGENNTFYTIRYRKTPKPE